MGYLVSICSAVNSCEKTIFTYLLSRHLSSLLGPDRTLMACCAGMNSGMLMDLYGVSRSELNLEDMVNINMHLAGSRLNLFNMMERQGGIYLAGSANTGWPYLSGNISAYRALINQFKDFCEVCIMETFPGEDGGLAGITLDNSDLIIDVVPQSEKCRAAAGQKLPVEKGDAEVFIKTGISEGKDKAAYTDSVPGHAFVLPYCRKLEDMKRKGRLHLYLHYKTEYKYCLDRITRHLCGKLGISICRHINGEGADTGRRGLARWLSEGFG